jgi:exopolysaccharide biosynthesis polyprenyl glycosylphosphotransferase
MTDVSYRMGQAATRRSLVPDKELKRLQCYGLIAIYDLLALGGAFLSANLLYLHDATNQHGMMMLSMLAPIYIGVASMNGAYSTVAINSLRRGLTRSLQSLAFSASAIVFIAYFLKSTDEFSRAVFLIGSIFSAVLLYIGRVASRRQALNALGGTPFATVIVTDGVEYSEGSTHDIVVSAQELNFDPSTSDPMRFNELAQKIGDADRVIVTCAPDRVRLWASALRSLAVNGEIISNDIDDLGIIAVHQYGTHRTLLVAKGPLQLHERVLKRTFDVTFAFFGLILVSPILVATAITIKAESKGPIFFKQDRIGRDNRIFSMFKFRSMYVEMCDPNATQLTLRSDPRVTRVGEFIRRTSIDELPQLLNVLRGDMSLVGPRPHALSAKAADRLYWDVDPRYRHRHTMKPGITGLAQIRGYRGNTLQLEDLVNRLQSDLEYAEDWSIWKDIQIILLTLAVLRHNNAF